MRAGNVAVQVIENMVARDGVEPPTPAFQGYVMLCFKQLK
jgi:hypothetical protein